MSEFERCRSYAQSIADLNAACAAHETARAKLVDKRKECLDRIDGTAVDFAQLAQLTQLNSYMLIENGFLQVQTRLAMENDTRPDNRASYNTRQNLPQPITVLSQVDQQAVLAAVNGDFLAQQLKELDAASRLVMERRLRAVRGLLAVSQELEAWQEKYRTLAEQYWSVADVVRVRSRLEHRAGLRELGKADPENPGANFAKAILQANLAQYDKALSTLASLQGVPQWSTLAVAAQAHIAALQGNPKAAHQYLREAALRGKQDPRVHLMRAHAFAILGDRETSKQEWEVVLKYGKEEIAAHRALALIYASAPSRTQRITDQAMEHATLASKLAGEDQWSCQIALALAQAAAGAADQALASALQAQRLAIGEQKRRCDDVARQIGAGQHVVWKVH